MLRRLFKALSALSLLLCFLSLALLARGHWAHDYLTWARADANFVSINSEGGVVIVDVIHSDRARHIEWQVLPSYAIAFPTAVRLGHPGDPSIDLVVVSIETDQAGAVFWRRGEQSAVYPVVRIVWHWAMIAMIAGVLPASRFVMWFVRRFGGRVRRAAGLCLRCGYDLRATPGRCPECGTPAAMKGA